MTMRVRTEVKGRMSDVSLESEAFQFSDKAYKSQNIIEIK